MKKVSVLFFFLYILQTPCLYSQNSFEKISKIINKIDTRQNRTLIQATLKLLVGAGCVVGGVKMYSHSTDFNEQLARATQRAHNVDGKTDQITQERDEYHTATFEILKKCHELLDEQKTSHFSWFIPSSSLSVNAINTDNDPSYAETAPYKNLLEKIKTSPSHIENNIQNLQKQHQPITRYVKGTIGTITVGGACLILNGIADLVDLVNQYKKSRDNGAKKKKM